MAARMAIDRFVERHDWQVEQIDDTTVAAMVAGADAQWPMLITAVGDTDQEFFIVYSLLPAEMADGARGQVVEAVARANDGLPVGTFEVDFDTDELRCRTGVEVPAALRGDATGDVLVDLVDDAVVANIELVDRYLSALQAVAAGDLDAEAAVKAVEGG